MAYKLQEGFPLRAVYYAQFIKYERLNYSGNTFNIMNNQNG